MIFTKEHARMVVDRRKRQTRRPVKPGEYSVLRIGTDRILSVIGANGRLKWQLGKDYAAQPGRGKKSIGRTPRLIEIRQEMLQEMTPLDLRDEMGCLKGDPRRFAIYALPNFIKLWDSLYPKPGYRWGDNPEVWVLVFESVAAIADERLRAASLDRIARREGLTYSNMERFARGEEQG